MPKNRVLVLDDGWSDVKLAVDGPAGAEEIVAHYYRLRPDHTHWRLLREQGPDIGWPKEIEERHLTALRISGNIDVLKRSK